MKTIPLTRGQVAIVCDCHAHLVENNKWHAQWVPHKNQFCAARDAILSEIAQGKPVKIYMHSVINGTPKGGITDHVDNNSLNNQCTNLRNANNSQNQHNKAKYSNNTSGYKGVSWSKQEGMWIARIGLNGKAIQIGLFDTAAQAARAYDEKARELHGEFANINFKE